MKFLLHCRVQKIGIFNIATYDITEVIQSENLATAYEEQIARARNLSEPGFLFTVTKIEPI